MGNVRKSASDSKAVDPLEVTLARLEMKLAHRSPAEFPVRSQVLRTGKIYQLPLWPESRRGVPNALVRGALFTVGNSRHERRYRKNTVIATLGGIEINYTGEELRQDDEDVFLQLLHLSRLSPLGTEVKFTAHSLLKALHWPTNSRSYDRLRDTITRLSATGIEVRTEVGANQYGYSGSLVRDFEWAEPDRGPSRAWIIRLEPRIVALFGHVAYTQIAWGQRLKLGNLAKWLHSFYYTHSNPFPLKVETIHRLCGSTTKSPGKFRQLIKMALDELVAVGFLDSWELDPSKGLVRVSRTQPHAGCDVTPPSLPQSTKSTSRALRPA